MELSNGHLKLLFNESGHLTSWTDLVTSASYSLQHEYLQEVEKAGLIEVDVCTGTSVYTFVPDDGSHVLTPKVIACKILHCCKSIMHACTCTCICTCAHIY